MKYLNYIIHKTFALIIILLFLSNNILAQQWIQKGTGFQPDCDDFYTTNFVDISGSGTHVAIHEWPTSSTSSCEYGIKVFEWNNLEWQAKGSVITEVNLNVPNESLKMNYNGDVLIASANGSSHAIGTAKVFHWISNTWVQKGNTLADIDSSAEFGNYVSIDSTGNTVMVGYINADQETIIKVYDWVSPIWVQRGPDLVYGNTLTSDFSIDLSLSGNTIAFSYEESYTRYVRVFEWNISTWVDKGSISGSYTSNFGASIDLNTNGNTIVIGAPSHLETAYNEGKVNIYDWQDGDWVLRGIPFIGEYASCELGIVVSISSHSNRIMVGYQSGVYPREDSLKVYDWLDTEWVQHGNTIALDDYPNLGNMSVFWADMSEDGNSIIVSAIDNYNTTSEVQGAVTFHLSEPFACFEQLDSIVECGENVNFKALCSSHTISNNQIVSYEWDFDNDGLYDLTGDDVFYEFTTAGIYPVTLKVTDANDQSDLMTQTITVNNLSDSIYKHIDTYYAISTGSITSYHYQWFSCEDDMPIANANNSTFTPTENGVYAVNISNDHCEVQSNCLEINNLNNTNQLNNNLNIRYQSETNQIILDHYNGTSPIKIRIVDLIGREYQVEHIGNTIDFIQPSGIYMAQITLESDHSIMNFKFVVH